MPEIEITGDQRERLRAVQEALESDVVGKYGHVRASDAVEYLLDRYEAEEGTGQVEVDDAGEGGNGAGGEEADDGTNDAGEGADDAGEEADDAGEGTDDGTDDAAETAEGDAVTGDDDAELDAMMNLLAEHDDRWHESDASDARYAVELPDGTTEHARTKDDVRGLLFRHFR